MIIKFFKYQGTGNDFVVIDNRSLQFPKDNLDVVRYLCSRKFGVGSDGLILIENHEYLDFNMVFFNPDGSQSFCGNGSRCALAFAHSLGMFEITTSFLSTDGEHEGRIDQEGTIWLRMHDVDTIEQGKDYTLMNTGSPHYVTTRSDLENLDVVQEGKAIRYSERFQEDGVNVNFVDAVENGIRVRTYERGVENETLSCGTGVTACALSFALKSDELLTSVDVKVEGGELKVSFEMSEAGFENIWLIGPAKYVYSGEIEV